MPHSTPQQRLIRDVTRAARSDSPLEVELAFGGVADTMTNEQLVDTMDQVVRRDAPGDPLVLKVLSVLGPAIVREQAGGLIAETDAELPEWADALGGVHLLRATRLSTLHRDIDIVWLEFAYPGDRWPHVVALGMAQILGGFDAIDIGAFETVAEMGAALAEDRVVLESYGMAEVEMDETYVRKRLPEAYRQGLEMAMFDGKGSDLAWTLGAHRLRVFSGVDVESIPWPPHEPR